MSHKEEPEEAGLRGPPPHSGKHPNGTPLEGSRPRWRPCQLHNPDAEGQGHHHQHYHHQANQHTSGSSRGPPRHRRRHAPGEAHRRRAESGDTEARAGQQPKPGVSRHHRSGERLHQHRYRQQHKEEEEEEQVVKTPPKEQTSEPLSPEDCSQDLLTPSPQDEPIIDGLDGNSPDLSHSSDTQVDPDPESSMEPVEEKVQCEESKLGEEDLVKENQEENYFRETPEQDYVPPKIASKSRPESKRTSPLRVDVPPFTTSPHQMMNKPFFQSPRTFPETLRSHNSDPKSYPAHFNTGYAHTNKDKGFVSAMSHVEDHQEDLSDSSPEAFPGPCDSEDLIDGIIFAANYLGSTQLLSERTPTKSARMQQAQEAMSRQGTDSGPPASTEVDLFISTQRIKVLSAYTQDTMMDHPLRTISYIADIGNMVVLMARRKMIRSQSAQENLDAAETQHTNPARDDCRQYRMICHVFESEDAQLIAQSIGQAFSVAYQEFLRANGIDPEDLSQREYSDLLNTQDMYNDDLIHFSKSENCRDVYIEKQKGEILGVVIVESGWGSILPTVIIASLMHGGPAAKSGRLNIGDQIMTVNGTSLVGLPLSTCQSIIKGLKAQSRIKLNIVRCPPVTMVLIRRPDLRYQLGFSVQNGIICSLMRGGIAERGGVRVGHRIIEINSQSVVATAHEKIVHILSNAVGEIHMKTMPAAMYRLLTAQEQPVYI
uniref:Amyloid-beta A4 precursor protein-binding family A member 3 n=1 Tax=Sinocyclocheilus rhinocerous TaxID=307959 RepID=A0A673GHF4_9TELE